MILDKSNNKDESIKWMNNYIANRITIPVQTDSYSQYQPIKQTTIRNKEIELMAKSIHIALPNEVEHKFFIEKINRAHYSRLNKLPSLNVKISLDSWKKFHEMKNPKQLFYGKLTSRRLLESLINDNYQNYLNKKKENRENSKARKDASEVDKESLKGVKLKKNIAKN
ncbi:hypothetical protein I6M49_22575 [Shewanella algae]|uniref:hypothetical protein n=1 Tax=Shewanella algae TaxID=38313 RepID=UPI001AAD59CE|nr:hypothetical protein [Shewanella algae]MBO2656232.1 hypothetical protein [Shewanella algae]